MSAAEEAVELASDEHYGCAADNLQPVDERQGDGAEHLSAQLHDEPLSAQNHDEHQQESAAVAQIAEG